MRFKYTLLATVVGLLIIIAFISSSNARLQNENELLRQKLATAEGVTSGLRENQEKLIRYHECIAKIFIIPRDQNKAIEGSLDDPATALEQCRILIGDDIISPDSSGGSSPNQPSNTQTPSNTQQPGGGSTATPPPDNPPPPPPPDDGLLDDDIPIIGPLL